MELDEAIAHALGIAEENENEARFYVHPQYPGVKETIDKCLQCAAEHRQLAEWLRELKGLRLLTEWAIQCGFGYDNIPEEYEKHKEIIKDMGYDEGLIFIATQEANIENGSEA